MELPLLVDAHERRESAGGGVVRVGGGRRVREGVFLERRVSQDAHGHQKTVLTRTLPPPRASKPSGMPQMLLSSASCCRYRLLMALALSRYVTDAPEAPRAACSSFVRCDRRLACTKNGRYTGTSGSSQSAPAL